MLDLWGKAMGHEGWRGPSGLHRFTLAASCKRRQ